MRSSLLGPFVAGLPGLLALACAAPGAGDTLERDAAEGASSAALIVIERTVTADGMAHGSAVARFMKMRSGSLDEVTLRMVGATLDLPAPGTCAEGAPADSASRSGVFDDLAPASGGPRAVELLDVGSVAFDANGLHTSFEARALPDIVDLVTGVLYSTRASTLDADGLPPHGSYILRSTGSVQVADPERVVPAFSVSATAVGEPDELRVDGQDAHAADGVSLSAGARVDLAWRVGGDTADPDDVVYVELLSAVDATADGSRINVRCTFADHGVAVIPASVFATASARVTDIGADVGEIAHSEVTRGTLVVHRIHREVFQVGGIESGVIRFDFARAAEFTRR
jgi:hypothetical protein